MLKMVDCTATRALHMDSSSYEILSFQDIFRDVSQFSFVSLSHDTSSTLAYFVTMPLQLQQPLQRR